LIIRSATATWFNRLRIFVSAAYELLGGTLASHPAYGTKLSGCCYGA
jgi:hypothetical protein